MVGFQESFVHLSQYLHDTEPSYTISTSERNLCIHIRLYYPVYSSNHKRLEIIYYRAQPNEWMIVVILLDVGNGSVAVTSIIQRASRLIQNVRRLFLSFFDFFWCHFRISNLKKKIHKKIIRASVNGSGTGSQLLPLQHIIGLKLLIWLTPWIFDGRSFALRFWKTWDKVGFCFSPPLSLPSPAEQRNIERKRETQTESSSRKENINIHWKTLSLFLL